jgi:prephenate dehydrogenase
MVLIIGIGIVVYWFVKDNKRKKLKKRFTKHQKKATNLLNTLEQKALAKGEVKAYYSELTDIAGTILKRQ